MWLSIGSFPARWSSWARNHHGSACRVPGFDWELSFWDAEVVSGPYCFLNESPVFQLISPRSSSWLLESLHQMDNFLRVSLIQTGQSSFCLMWGAEESAHLSVGLWLQTQLPSASLVGQLAFAQNLYHMFRSITAVPGAIIKWIMDNSLSGRSVAVLIGWR